MRSDNVLVIFVACNGTVRVSDSILMDQIPSGEKEDDTTAKMHTIFFSLSWGKSEINTTWKVTVSYSTLQRAFYLKQNIGHWSLLSIIK